MTARSLLPDHPPDRVRHSWRCARRAPTVETVKTDVLGRGHVVAMCTECGHDDMTERLRNDRHPAGATEEGELTP